MEYSTIAYYIFYYLLMAIGIIVAVGGYIKLAYHLLKYYKENKQLKILLQAGYTKEGVYSSYKAPDGWTTSELEKAATRADLQIKIKEYRLEEQGGKQLLDQTSAELEPLGHTTPEMATWLASAGIES